ncbi:MAG: hypothetical protein PHP82_01335 [Candidatus ainarchaeum sp.]|nr:hypothetical protein [Candidatus ainarchaeum sp.]
MAIFFLILIWVIEYFNPAGENIILNHLNLFLLNNWIIIVLFVLIMGVWDYLYRIFGNSRLRYFAPFFDSIGTFFAFWVIGIIFNGLRLFIESDNPLNIFLAFLHDLVYGQTVLLFLLILFALYSKFFLKNYNY